MEWFPQLWDQLTELSQGTLSVWIFVETCKYLVHTYEAVLNASGEYTELFKLFEPYYKVIKMVSIECDSLLFFFLF